MAVAVDSSVAVSWGTPDENSTLADKALTLATSSGVIVPDVFWHELRGVLLANERRPDDRAVLEQRAGPCPGHETGDAQQRRARAAVLELARRHALSAYDAAYLELAVRLKAVLATLDKRLANAEGLTIVQP